MKEWNLQEIESSAVLSDQGIMAERDRGRIIIEPFNERNVQTSSYDVTLGENYFVKQKIDSPILNMFDLETPRKIWGEPQIATFAGRFFEGTSLELTTGIYDTDRVILVPPGELLLIHSEEFAGSVKGYTTLVRSKSTLERMGIGVAISAGFGDVGYFDRWTFALKNWHDDKTVPLVVGMTFAQIVFLKCTPTGRSYSDEGTYQASSDLKEVMRSWTPSRMLPRVIKEIRR